MKGSIPPSTAPKEGMMTSMSPRPLALPAFLRVLGVALAAGFAVAPTAAVAAPAHRYAFVLLGVTPKADAGPELVKAVADAATARVKGQVQKAFDGGHPQLVKLDGAPDPANGAAYRKFLASHKIDGAYVVSVEITEASEEIEPMPDKASSQRLTVRLALHMLGETLPQKTIGFTGDGRAIIKQEIGKKVRESDRTFAWDSAAEVAVQDALKTVFTQLAVPPKKAKKP
jgi:hypothetical protein